jgi:hypothetical protein
MAFPSCLRTVIDQRIHAIYGNCDMCLRSVFIDGEQLCIRRLFQNLFEAL